MSFPHGIQNPITSLTREPLQLEHMMDKGPFYFIICLLEIHLKQNSVLFIAVDRVQGFMQNHNPFDDISSFNKGSLGIRNNRIYHSTQYVHQNFCDDFKHVHIS